MKLGEPITSVAGVGEELAKKLAVLGVRTVIDLLNYYPRRYEDYSTITPIKQIKPGAVSIQATIKQVKGRYVRRGLHITEAIASDEGDSVRLVWFNQPYRENSLKPGAEYYISGHFELSRQRLSIMNPSIELVQAFPVNTARILPVYRETKGINSKQIRRIVREVITLVRNLEDNLPEWIVKKQKLPSHASAIETIHFPKSTEDLETAKRRLGFEEVFSLSLASLLNKSESANERSIQIPFQELLAKQFVKHLPFTLTDGQRKAVWKIYKDMQKEQPMNRLLEGDVGSGKTVVAGMAALMAIEEGYQVAFMAPTELLARQHADTLYKLFDPMHMSNKVGLLTGSMSQTQKKAALNSIKKGEMQLIIGTHALIEERVDMHKLGLIIIDEQHRFGVEQRKKLLQKAGHMPHVLCLTATPIPRSLALTLYGELDISVLTDLPANRKPIITKICSPNSKKQLYQKIESQFTNGRQVFVVCPAISEDNAIDVRAVEAVYKEMKQRFNNYKVAVLHGKQKPQTKNETMEQFVNHEIDLIVSTTVIEVGVDVPNATVMLVESAERFGLAQLHQLRGRVGRSEHQGYCYLLLSDSKAPSKRLRALESSNNGFKLAELDLEIRGPGAIYGTYQHGALDLRIAKLSDTRLIADARESAQAFIDKKENLRHYKELFSTVTRLRTVTNLN